MWSLSQRVKEQGARRLPIARDEFFVRCWCGKYFRLEETSFDGGRACWDFISCVEKEHTMHFEAPFPNGESGSQNESDDEADDETATQADDETATQYDNESSDEHEADDETATQYDYESSDEHEADDEAQ